MKVFLYDLLSAVSKATTISPSHSLLSLRTEAERLLVSAASFINSIEISLPCQGELNHVLVDCKLFHAFLSKAWGESISLVLESNQLVVGGEFGEARFTTFPADHYAQPSWIEAEQTIDLPDLRSCDKQLLFSVADQTKPLLCSVHFLLTNNKLRLTTTDGYRLTIKTIPLSNSVEASFIVDPESAEQIFALSPGKLSIKSGKVQIENNNTRFLARLIDGQYPNIGSILSQENQSCCRFQRDEMMQALKTALVFANKSRVKLEFGENITIFSDNKEENRGRCQVRVAYENLTGDAPSFCCNPNFVLDWLRSVKNDVVEMEWVLPNRAIFLKQGSNLGVIMPMVDR